MTAVPDVVFALVSVEADCSVFLSAARKGRGAIVDRLCEDISGEKQQRHKTSSSDLTDAAQKIVAAVKAT